MNAVCLNESSWASVVSDLCSPPVVLTILAWFGAQHDSETVGQTFFLGWWVRQGKTSNIHMPERRERFWPLALELGCTFAVWIILTLLGRYPGINLVASFLLVETFIGLAVTYYWQISVHAGIMALVLTPFILLVAAARLRLKRHTVSQVIAGITVGVIAPPLLYSLIMQAR
jgi:membrane-associated phospholipid phosphatase